MAIDKTINLKTTLDEKGLNELESGLKRVDKEQKNVSSSAKKAGASVDDLASNGGAIAILDSLTGGLATKLKDTYEAAKLFNFSLKGTRTALIATGIGAFVVALGLVVAYWDEIVEFITGANEALEEQHTALTQNLSLIDSELKLLDKKKKFNEANGISNDELLKKQKEILIEKKKIIAEDIKILEAQLLREESAAKEVGWFKQLLNIRAGIIQKDDVIDPEESKRIADLRLQINALKGDAIETNQAIIDIDNPKEPEPVKRDKQTALGRALTAEEQAAELQKKQKQFEELFGLEAMQKQALVDLNKSALDAISNDKNIKDAEQAVNDAKYSEIRKKQLDDEAKLKRMLQQQALSDASNTFDQIAQIAGKDSKIGKAMAIASATINGIQGVQNAYTTAQSSPISVFFPAYPIVQATLAGIVAAKNIAAIKSINPQNGGGSINANASGGGASAPSFNVVGTSGTNQLAQSLQQQQAPIQAYVVGSNVTTQQELDRNIVDTVTLG